MVVKAEPEYLITLEGINKSYSYHISTINPRQRSQAIPGFNWLFLNGITLMVLRETWEAAMLLIVLHWANWQKVITGTILTALRVLTVLVLSLVGTVPVGVAINRNLCIAQTLQPLVPIVAAVPATALFPILLLALTHVSDGVKIGFIVLMVLGTMLYVLFNVITALSILSEQGQIQTIPGLGATISQAIASVNLPLLLVATSLMFLTAVFFSRLLAGLIYCLVQKNYQLIV